MNKCLRCKNVFLEQLASPPAIFFYVCPQCERQYAKKDRLTFRWGHPISLALYPVIFDEFPCGHAEIAKIFKDTMPDEEIKVMVKEIELELEYPTQNVREILDSCATETELRKYLKLLAQSLL